MNSTGDSVGFDRYFYANVTDKSFYETQFGIFYRASNLLANSLGMIAICLLFYMIRHKTPVSFRPYSKLLYFCLAVDFYCVLIQLCNQVRYKLTPSFSIIVFGGVASLLNQRGQCYFNNFSILVPQIQCLILPIFALYRHNHIKNKIAPTTNQLLSYCFVAAIPLIFSLITSSLTECTTQQITTEILLSWYVETPLPEVFVVVDFKKVQYAKIGFIYRKLVAYGPYVLTVCISIASVRLLRREWPKLNKKAKATQLVFAKILILQAAVPLMSMILPNIIMTILTFVHTSFEAGEWAIICLTWATPLNVICSLFIIAPYRRVLYRMLFGSCSRKQTNPTVSTIFVSNSRLT